MKRVLWIGLLAGILLSLALTAGCGVTKIGDILENFSEYEGEKVTVEGTVGETVWFPILDRGAFQVGDGSGTIWVVSDRPPPQEGEEVTVSGTISSAFKLEERSLGKVIVETERR